VAELLGTHSYQLDPKGRISLPVRFREAFSDGAYLTLGQDGCLFCFPREQWERRSDEVDSALLADAEGRAYQRLFFSNAERAELDAQGRLLVSQKLRAAAGVGKEVVVLGVKDRMEIWDREAHERYASAFSGAYVAGTLGSGRTG